jgi:hypothetical protein
MAMLTGKAIGLRHVQDITNTFQAIGSREDMDGFGFEGIGISAWHWRRR